MRPLGRVVTAVVNCVATMRERLGKARIVAVIGIEDVGGCGTHHFLEMVKPGDIVNRKVFRMRMKAVR